MRLLTTLTGSRIGCWFACPGLATLNKMVLPLAAWPLWVQPLAQWLLLQAATRGCFVIATVTILKHGVRTASYYDLQHAEALCMFSMVLISVSEMQSLHCYGIMAELSTAYYICH